MTPEKLRELEALREREPAGRWQRGEAGRADLVRYDGDDIVGIATVHSPLRIDYIAALHNAASELIAAARRLDALEEVKDAQESAFPHLPEVALRHAEELDRLRENENAKRDSLAQEIHETLVSRGLHSSGAKNGADLIRCVADALDRLRAENERLLAEIVGQQSELHHLRGCRHLLLEDVARERERAERAEAALAKGVVVPVETLLAFRREFEREELFGFADAVRELLPTAAKEEQRNG